MKITLLVSIFLFAIFPGPSFSKSFGPKHDKVAKLFQGNEEPKAKDAVWTQEDIFKIGVIDDGTNRDGYAEYACAVLYKEGFKGKRVWVQIIDIVKLNKIGEWVRLGEAKCR